MNLIDLRVFFFITRRRGLGRRFYGKCTIAVLMNAFVLRISKTLGFIAIGANKPLYFTEHSSVIRNLHITLPDSTCDDNPPVKVC